MTRTCRTLALLTLGCTMVSGANADYLVTPITGPNTLVYPNDINDSGVVVGKIVAYNGVIWENHAFTYVDGLLTMLDTSSLPGDPTAIGVSPTGHIVGNTYDAPNFVSHGFIY